MSNEQLRGALSKVLSQTTESVFTNPYSLGRVIPDKEDLSIGKARYLNLAVMYIDICGFSKREMHTREEQDRMVYEMQIFFREMVNIAMKHNGTIEKHTGDGLMLYFEDVGDVKGCERAVDCAIEMFEANNIKISIQLGLSGHKPFQFRISMDYGYVSIAKIGMAKQFNCCVAIGPAANFASKMLRHAEPNQLVIGENAKNNLSLKAQGHFFLTLKNTEWFHHNTTQSYNLFKYLG